MRGPCPRGAHSGLRSGCCPQDLGRAQLQHCGRSSILSRDLGRLQASPCNLSPQLEPPHPPHHEEVQVQLYQIPECGPRKQSGWDPVRAPSLWVFSHELRGQTGPGTESWQAVTVPT